MDFETVLRALTVYIVPTLFAITLHEVAHGWVAKKLGDNTAFSLGRLTINPIKHIDPIGTILVPLMCVLGAALVGASPMLFGWAKPVPVNLRNLRNPKTDMAKVAMAGPLCNLIQAIFWALLGFKLLPSLGINEVFLTEVARAGVLVNIILMAVNLLPVPPLDGGRILVGILPKPYDYYLARIEPYGFFIVLFLMLTKTLSIVVGPLVNVGLWIIKLFI
jgi:Zn-dependent protease